MDLMWVQFFYFSRAFGVHNYYNVIIITQGLKITSQHIICIKHIKIIDKQINVVKCVIPWVITVCPYIHGIQFYI